MEEIDWSEYGGCPTCKSTVHVSQLGNEDGQTCCMYCYEQVRELKEEKSILTFELKTLSENFKTVCKYRDDEQVKYIKENTQSMERIKELEKNSNYYYKLYTELFKKIQSIFDYTEDMSTRHSYAYHLLAVKKKLKTLLKQ